MVSPLRVYVRPHLQHQDVALSGQDRLHPMQRVAVKYYCIALLHCHAKQRSPAITTIYTIITVRTVFFNNIAIEITNSITIVSTAGYVLLLALNDELSTCEVAAARVAEHNDDCENRLRILVQHELSAGMVN